MVNTNKVIEYMRGGDRNKAEMIMLSKIFAEHFTDEQIDIIRAYTSDLIISVDLLTDATAKIAYDHDADDEHTFDECEMANITIGKFRIFFNNTRESWARLDISFNDWTLLRVKDHEMSPGQSMANASTIFYSCRAPIDELVTQLRYATADDYNYQHDHACRLESMVQILRTAHIDAAARREPMNLSNATMSELINRVREHYTPPANRTIKNLTIEEVEQ